MKATDLRWFHSIDLPGEGTTVGYQPPERLRRKLDSLCLNSGNVGGKSVLDVGAWDGYFSFAMERLGAARIVACDRPGRWGGWGSKVPFEYARKALDSSVEDVEVDALDLSPLRCGGSFDVVLHLGILYHLQDMMAGLRAAFSVTSDLLVLETHIDLYGDDRPVAAFYPHNEVNNDPTNWWGPNPACVVEMLKAVGFEKAYFVRILEGFGDGAYEGNPRMGRMVFHATK